MFRSVHYASAVSRPRWPVLRSASAAWLVHGKCAAPEWLGQIAGAVVAAALLAMLLVRFVLHADTLVKDLAHPVVGSIVPTFAMSLMVVARALYDAFPDFALALWCAAVAGHLMALAAFIYFRAKERILPNMVPSWFVPPVGIIVADVTFPGSEALLPFAHVLLAIGMCAYAIMLPVMLYRLIFFEEVPNAAKPTIAIMAAPASLSLAAISRWSNRPLF